MKIEKVETELLHNNSKLIITFQNGENRAIGRLCEEIGTIYPDKDYEVSIKPKRKKRSLDANAYCWVLIGKLGEKLNKSDLEIYREYIRDNGVFEIVPIKENAIKRWVQIWKSRGLGWVCEDLGECRNTKGYHNIKSYYGSSTYNSKEMARLIDAIVWDCKEQGIEVLAPKELERLKAMWEGN